MCELRVRVRVCNVYGINIHGRCKVWFGVPGCYLACHHRINSLDTLLVLSWGDLLPTKVPCEGHKAQILSGVWGRDPDTTNRGANERTNRTIRPGTIGGFPRQFFSRPRASFLTFLARLTTWGRGHAVERINSVSDTTYFRASHS